MLGRLIWAGMAPIALAVFHEKVAKAPPLTTQKVRPPPPEVIPLPTGWQYAKYKQITPDMQQFAIAVRDRKLLPGDLQIATSSTGQRYGAFTEWHYDDHVSPEEKWHHGVSLVLPSGA